MSKTSSQPIHQRTHADIDQLRELVLVLADDPDTTYARIREQLGDLDLSLFGVEENPPLGPPVKPSDVQPQTRQPFASLYFFDAVGYVTDFYLPVDEDEPVHLTERGSRAADALSNGLTDDQYAALQEVDY